MSRVSIALENLRGFVIVMVLAFHSFMAYMVSLPPSPSPFDTPPYEWTAHPIIDSHRWIGFDLFGAFQFLHLMQLMFFLSGLFVLPSLMRKGARAFLVDRVLRLGVPFVLGVALLMPLAYFPVYRVSAINPSWSAFWSHWTALSFWPSGPLWFLWFLLTLNAAAAAVYWMVPRAREGLAGISALAGAHPGRFFVGLIIVSAFAYLPVAAFFAPWQWTELGPIAIQPGFAPQYCIYFLAGVAVGAGGIERGLLADAMLSQRWPVWLAGVFGAFLLWVVPAALIVKGHDAEVLRIARESGLVLFAAVGCFGTSAIFLRFATTRRPILASISENAYGIYLFHYVFVIWTQYALLDIELPAIAKGGIVLAVTLALSWMLTAIVSSAPFGARVMRGERRASMDRRHSGTPKEAS
jgi:glucans biosynthesis protein C